MGFRERFRGLFFWVLVFGGGGIVDIRSYILGFRMLVLMVYFVIYLMSGCGGIMGYGEGVFG